MLNEIRLVVLGGGGIWRNLTAYVCLLSEMKYQNIVISEQ